MLGYLSTNKTSRVVKNQKGITLIELLAVIVILGIIAAIAVPAIGGMISKSKINADRESYNIIKDAGLRYAMTENINADVEIPVVGDGVNPGLVSSGYLNEEPIPQSNKIEGGKFTAVKITVSSSGTYSVDVLDAANPDPEVINPATW